MPFFNTAAYHFSGIGMGGNRRRWRNCPADRDRHGGSSPPAAFAWPPRRRWLGDSNGVYCRRTAIARQALASNQISNAKEKGCQCNDLDGGPQNPHQRTLLLLNFHQNPGAGGDKVGSPARVLLEKQQALAKQECIEKHSAGVCVRRRKPELPIERASRFQARRVHPFSSRCGSRISSRPLPYCKFNRHALLVGAFGV